MKFQDFRYPPQTRSKNWVNDISQAGMCQQVIKT